MSDVAQDLLSLELPCDEQAPARVRSALAEAHRDDWPLQDGLLVASELVTNAVRHSGCRPDDRLRVDVSLQPDTLIISVHDPGGSDRRAEAAPEGQHEPGGWGLRIIEQLSRRWGAQRPDGYLVWAELSTGQR